MSEMRIKQEISNSALGSSSLSVYEELMSNYMIMRSQLPAKYAYLFDFINYLLMEKLNINDLFAFLDDVINRVSYDDNLKPILYSLNTIFRSLASERFARAVYDTYELFYNKNGPNYVFSKVKGDYHQFITSLSKVLALLASVLLMSDCDSDQCFKVCNKHSDFPCRETISNFPEYDNKYVSYPHDHVFLLIMPDQEELKEAISNETNIGTINVRYNDIIAIVRPSQLIMKKLEPGRFYKLSDLILHLLEKTWVPEENTYNPVSVLVTIRDLLNEFVGNMLRPLHNLDAHLSRIESEVGAIPSGLRFFSVVVGNKPIRFREALGGRRIIREISFEEGSSLIITKSAVVLFISIKRGGKSHVYFVFTNLDKLTEENVGRAVIDIYSMMRKYFDTIKNEDERREIAQRLYKAINSAIDFLLYPPEISSNIGIDLSETPKMIPNFDWFIHLLESLLIVISGYMQ